MKTFYKYLVLSFCWLGAVTLQAQTRIGLGKATDLIANYKLKADAKIINANSANNKIRQAVPGQRALVLDINVNKKEGPADVFIGKVEGKKNSSFYLRAEGSEISGFIILKDQKKAYQYSSDANGQALLQEVDINKVICVDFKQNSPVKMDAPRQAAATSAAVPILESYPGAGAVVLLDFDGQYVSGTPWNGGSPINAAPSTLTSAEMEGVWKIMSEDFRPYALNITTNEAVFNSVPANRRMRVIFTPTTTAYPGSGGVAYIGSFNWNDNTPCWVYNTGIKGAGDTGSHEVGHTLKLGHDGRTSPAETYFYGQGSWAPIMGASFYSPQAQWSKGEYAAANNTEDDLAIIATNGFGYRPDESTRSLVKDINGNVLSASNRGVITTRGDIDVFTFITDGGNVTLNVNPSPTDPNLDVYLTLYNSAFALVGSSNPANMSASINAILPAGTYYLYIDGTMGAMGANSDYGSLGEYFVSGFVPSYCFPTVTYGCGSGDIINNFSFNTLVNNGSGCNGQPDGYIKYNPVGSLTTQVSRGQTYNISMQSGATYAQGFGVWIDYNNDLDFSDAGEFVYSSPTAGTGIYSGTVTVPAGTSLGNKRMRVRAKYNSVFTSTQSCTAATYGETEDYTITIVNPTTIWNVRFGGSTTETFAEVIKTTDGGYLLGGTSISGVSGDKTQAGQGSYDYWIVKTNSAGVKLWDKRFGGSAQDYLTTMIQTSDGGYLLGGRSYSGVTGDKSQAAWGGADFWIVKISSTGVKQWDKRYGGTGLDDLRKVIQLSTGEYVLAGYSDSPISGDKTQASRGALDYWVVKIKSTGTKIWDKRFGGTSTDFLATMVPTSTGFLLGGESSSGIGGDKTEASRGAKDYWVVSINTSGTKLWDKRFGGTADDFLNSIVPVAGNFLLAGESLSGVTGDKTQASYGGKDQWIVMINSAGAKLFDQRYGGSADDLLESAISTSGGGFLLGGTSASGIGGSKTQPSQGGTDYWIVATNSSGTKLWDKRYGGSSTDNLNTVLALTDGYLLGGSSASGIGGDKTQASRGGSDYWLVKVSPSGGFAAPVASEPVIASTSATSAEKPATTAAKVAFKPEVVPSGLNLRSAPNPVTDRLSVSFSLPETQPVNLQIYDSQGHAVKTLFDEEAQANKTYEVEWRPQGSEAAGLYILHFRSKTEVKQQKILYRK